MVSIRPPDSMKKTSPFKVIGVGEAELGAARSPSYNTVEQTDLAIILSSQAEARLEVFTK